MFLQIFRALFLILVVGVSSLYLLGGIEQEAIGYDQFVIILIAAIAGATIVLGVDIGIRNKDFSTFTGLFFGLVVGLIGAFAISMLVDLFGAITQPTATLPNVMPDDPVYQTVLSESQSASPLDNEAFHAKRRLSDYDEKIAAYQDDMQAQTAYKHLLEGIKIVLGACSIYFATSLVLQTKDRFRFILPYIEFQKEHRGTKSLIIDTSILIDGRILDLVEQQIFQNPLILPDFVLAELQLLADSKDNLKRERGRRGLRLARQLRETKADISLFESDQDTQNNLEVDRNILDLAKHLNAKILTTDYGLAKLSEAHNVTCLNLQEVSRLLQPKYLPGDPLELTISKPGESAKQGVGFLPNGTMVVVENARDLIGKDINATVTSTIQTHAGAMIFAKPQQAANQATSA